MSPLSGQALVDVAADYILDDPGTSYDYLYDRLRRDHELSVSRRSFVSGGYATAAKRLADARTPAEPEPPAPLPPAETPLPPNALTRAELAEERRKYRERQARRDREHERKAKRVREAFALPQLRTGRNHPFARDFAIGKKRRKNPGVLGDVEYLPPAEFLDTGIRRR